MSKLLDQISFPSRSKVAASPFPKRTWTHWPSAAGVGDERGISSSSSVAAALVGETAAADFTSLRQRSFPESASKQKASRRFFSAPVRNRRFPSTTGELG